MRPLQDFNYDLYDKVYILIVITNSQQTHLKQKTRLLIHPKPYQWCNRDAAKIHLPLLRRNHGNIHHIKLCIHRIPGVTVMHPLTIILSKNWT